MTSMPAWINSALKAKLLSQVGFDLEGEEEVLFRDLIEFANESSYPYDEKFSFYFDNLSIIPCESMGREVFTITNKRTDHRAIVWDIGYFREPVFTSLAPIYLKEFDEISENLQRYFAKNVLQNLSRRLVASRPFLSHALFEISKKIKVSAISKQLEESEQYQLNTAIENMRWFVLLHEFGHVIYQRTASEEIFKKREEMVDKCAALYIYKPLYMEKFLSGDTEDEKSEIVFMGSEIAAGKSIKAEQGKITVLGDNLIPNYLLTSVLSAISNPAAREELWCDINAISILHDYMNQRGMYFTNLKISLILLHYISCTLTGAELFFLHNAPPDPDYYSVLFVTDEERTRSELRIDYLIRLHRKTEETNQENPNHYHGSWCNLGTEFDAVLMNRFSRIGHYLMKNLMKFKHAADYNEKVAREKFHDDPSVVQKLLIAHFDHSGRFQ